MSPTLKRVLLIIGLLVVTALIGYGLYRLFVAPRQVVPTPPGTVPTTGRGQLPPAGERVPGQPGAPVTTLPTQPPGGAPAGITAPTIFRPAPVETVTTDAALFPSVNSQGQLRYHNALDGKFYQVLPDGTTKALTDQVFYNVQKVTWAPGSNKAVLEYPDDSKIIYNFQKQQQISLPKHWNDFSWSPQGDQLAAKSLGLAPENRWLIVTKDDGTGARLIEPLGENANRVTMAWSPNRQVVAFSQTGEPQGADRREVLFLGLNNENFKSTIVEGLDFVPQWSPTGARLLYSVDSARSDFKPELWIVDGSGDTIGNNRRNLNLNTWATKCAFGSEDTLYCAVPRDLPPGSGMLPEVANGSYDDLYKVDLKTGLHTPVPLGADYRVTNLNYDAAHGKLFFTDANQNGIFEVKL